MTEYVYTKFISDFDESVMLLRYSTNAYTILKENGSWISPHSTKFPAWYYEVGGWKLFHTAYIDTSEVVLSYNEVQRLMIELELVS